MTINQLQKQIAKMIAKGHGRRQVCVNTETFKHPLEGDGVVIVPVSIAEIETYEMADADGFLAERVDGTAIQRTVLVLAGEWR